MRAQQGIYGEFKTRLGGKLRLTVGVDLASYNTPTNGPTYLSHGVDVNFGVGRFKFGVSWQQKSYDGGLSFESDPTNFNFWDFKASSDGIDYEFAPPQAGSGFTVTAHDVDKGIPASGCTNPAGGAHP